MTPIMWTLSDDGSDTVSLNHERTIGFRQDTWTNNQTRYVRINTELLESWAKKVNEATKDNAVWVGVTPECPLTAKLSKDTDLSLAIAPYYDHGQDGVDS